MLDDALRDMADFAARGRVGAVRPTQPRLQLEVPQRVVRGAAAFVTWQALYAGEVHLTVTTPGRHPIQLRVPSRGQRPLRDLPVGRTEVRLVAVPLRDRTGLGLIERQAFIEVVHPEPLIEINAPNRVTYGAPFRFWWRVQDGNRIELVAPAGVQEIGAEGDLDFPLLDCGRHRFCIRAEGPGGRTERTISVQIVAPPVSFVLPARIVVEEGADVAVRYAVRGAARLSLKPIDRDEPAQLIPMAGVIHASGIMESERFVLTATGHDGRARKGEQMHDVRLGARNCRDRVPRATCRGCWSKRALNCAFAQLDPQRRPKMARFIPKVIDGEVIEVASDATLADVVSPDVQSVTTVGGHLIPRAEFARHGVPDGFERNLTPQVKG